MELFVILAGILGARGGPIEGWDREQVQKEEEEDEFCFTNEF